ncbi:VOC family protein [Streptomyces xinghaiensis]|uniref:VOC family protein n=1 Tax=Streptomyces xinghaiensis TaxID=1038928 RepID=UPI0002F6112B|nr:VOC family protein [Streptomyces xinghaiensis]MZE79592.1 glyoxalase/bleomycin resistance/dioxygenase family protein [Streptomyces sp. SID5475]
MAVHWKLVVDCADPLRLARFWAEALGYEQEDNSALIDRLIASGAGLVTDDDWTVVDGRKAWRTLAAVRHPEDPVDENTGAGLGRRVLFQAVPESKTVKNRLHIDLHFAPGERDAEVARLEGLGAGVLQTVDEPSGSWVVMADPEGNEFCVN